MTDAAVYMFTAGVVLLVLGLVLCLLTAAYRRGVVEGYLWVKGPWLEPKAGKVLRAAMAGGSRSVYTNGNTPAVVDCRLFASAVRSAVLDLDGERLVVVMPAAVDFAAEVRQALADMPEAELNAYNWTTALCVRLTAGGRVVLLDRMEAADHTAVVTDLRATEQSYRVNTRPCRVCGRPARAVNGHGLMHDDPAIDLDHLPEMDGY